MTYAKETVSNTGFYQNHVEEGNRRKFSNQHRGVKAQKAITTNQNDHQNTLKTQQEKCLRKAKPTITK